jgi:hypothetical protein
MNTTAANMTTQELYQQAFDMLSYVRAYAPNLPTTGNLGMESAQDEILDTLGRLLDIETNALARQWLSLARGEVNKAKVLFIEGDDREGRRRLEAARDHVAQARRRKPIKPDFVSGNCGFAE